MTSRRTLHVGFLAALAAARIAAASAAPPPTIAAYFSPRGGVADAVTQQIDSADHTIRVAAYSISEPRITAALERAHKRGVDVQIIVDVRQRSPLYTSAGRLRSAGIPTAIDATVQLYHHKYCIIDDSVVLTGSANFSRSADRDNAENLLVIHSAELAAQFSANWLASKRQATPYTIKKRPRVDPIHPPVPATTTTTTTPTQERPTSWHVYLDH